MSSYHSLPTFSDNLVRVVIETPKGAAAKFSYEPKADIFEFGRPLPAGIIYPYDWGFIPSTLGDDGDALDGLVVHHTVTAPGIVIKCRLLSALLGEQTEGGRPVTQRSLCPLSRERKRGRYRPERCASASEERDRAVFPSLDPG